jgi:primary-amine oxidase
VAITDSLIRHPLDALTTDEIETAVALVRGENRLSARARFALVWLSEPTKDLVRGFKDGDPVPREIAMTVLDKEVERVYRIRVSLPSGTIVSWDEVPGVQPPVFGEEWDLAEAAAKADPRFVEGCAKRGIDDLAYVFVDPVSAGNFGFPEEVGRRLVRGVAYWREDGRDNGYAYPIEGLIPIIDLNAGEVIEVWDSGAVAMPSSHGRYDLEAVGGTRDGVKPLEIVQPDGPSFTLDGNRLEWQKWSLRAQLMPREGLVLHDIQYDGRPVIYRAGLSEMVVPYGDPAQAHFWKAVFDAGEYGLGQMANSLRLGCDCLGEIRYMDAALADEFGEPFTISNAICIHEEDYGIAWKHFDARSEETEVRRLRRLVVSFICTVGNYDYGFFWYLYNDGTIEFEVKATGIMQTRALEPGNEGAYEYGAHIAPGLGAMNHQHIFSVRLDMAVDGDRNSVYEVNVDREPISEQNPHGQAMRARETLLGEERGAARDVCVDTSRYWKVVNPNVENELGQPTAYKLLPGPQDGLLCHPDSPMAQRGGFASHHVWVTQFDADEIYAAGDFPNQSDPASAPHGLPRWQEKNRNLDNDDVVLWYTVCHSHIPRPEDWPMTQVERTGFTMKPQGFFSRTPSLDLPRSEHSCNS